MKSISFMDRWHPV